MSKAKIMVVDDELEIVRALSMRLRVAGYEVVSASDGLMATNAAVREVPDVIILDIGMPCGNGYVVMDRLSKNSNTMGTPIIILTASSSPADRQRALQVGAFAFLSKPYDASVLLETVAQALSSIGK
jgi:CheY-like chemotaxis protein